MTCVYMSDNTQKQHHRLHLHDYNRRNTNTDKKYKAKIGSRYNRAAL